MTNIRSLTLAQMVQTVRDVVIERPERIYDTAGSHVCSYVRSADSPDGCVIGVALARLGIRRDYLARLDVGHPKSLMWSGTIGTVLRGLGMYPDPLSVDDYNRARWLEIVQGLQDGGNSWGSCVARADDMVPGV